jgi:hypothetical protein
MCRYNRIHRLEHDRTARDVTRYSSVDETHLLAGQSSHLSRASLQCVRESSLGTGGDPLTNRDRLCLRRSAIETSREENVCFSLEFAISD